MNEPFLRAPQYLEIKMACGKIYRCLKSRTRIPNQHHQVIFDLLGITDDTIYYYELYGTIEFKLVTRDITLLYVHNTDRSPDKS